MSNIKGFFALVESISNKKIQYYYIYQQELKKGDKVIIETDIGEEVGTLVSDLIYESEVEEKIGFSSILRKCSADDLSNIERIAKKNLIAEEHFNKSTAELNLDMKLVSTCYNLDESKILFTYYSESRVDFRELLKRLSSILKCRIELRQIGARDRTKIIGGIGSCGLTLCCKKFLYDFDGVSINMAKNQFLTLNTQKLSGPCGKLLCCLKFEDDFYTEQRSTFPELGKVFFYKDKKCRVTSINVLTEKIRIESMNRDYIDNISLTEYKNSFGKK